MAADRDIRLANEISHGEWIARHGEEIWNWSSPAGIARWRRRVSLFRQSLAGEGLDVLEIGCGTGLFTAEIAMMPHRITSIDISEALLETARQRIPGSRVTFVRADAHATGFPAASFDVILGSSCLHHLEPARALAEFFRLLRPGGRLLFTEPNMLNPQIAVQKNIPWFKRRAGDSPDETAFIRFALAGLLRRTGFTAIDITPFDFVHPALPASLLPLCIPLATLAERIPLLREIAGSLIITAVHP